MMSLRVDVAIWSQIPQGSRLETQPEFLHCRLESELLLLQETSLTALKPKASLFN